MNRLAERFARDGYVILDGVLDHSALSAVDTHIAAIPVAGAGSRNLLRYQWCRDLACHLKGNSAVRLLLPESAVAVQCTYFEKTSDQNWLVSLHRDRSIPIKRRIEGPGWSGWSEKEGGLFAQPPGSVLENLVAVRVHLEDNTELNSPLQVVPGSHAMEAAGQDRVYCFVRAGGALVMRPLILHASSKLASGSRRVLHFLFGPTTLPDSAEWAHAV